MVKTCHRILAFNTIQKVWKKIENYPIVYNTYASSMYIISVKYSRWMVPQPSLTRQSVFGCQKKESSPVCQDPVVQWLYCGIVKENKVSGYLVLYPNLPFPEILAFSLPIHPTVDKFWTGMQRVGCPLPLPIMSINWFYKTLVPLDQNWEHDLRIGPEVPFLTSSISNPYHKLGYKFLKWGYYTPTRLNKNFPVTSKMC